MTAEMDLAQNLQSTNSPYNSKAFVLVANPIRRQPVASARQTKWAFHGRIGNDKSACDR
jgi:hypothetical protein